MGFSAEQYALLAQQHWVVSVEQLVEHGMSIRTVGRHRRSGLLVSTVPGVLRLAAAPDDAASRRMAALLYIGGLSALTSQTAGAEYGLRRMYSRLIHVMVEESRNPRAAPWIKIHRTSWLDPSDIVQRPNGMRVLDPMRLLFELAGGFPKERFRGAAEDMWHKQLIEPVAASTFLQQIRRQGRGGVARFEEWLQETDYRDVAMMSGLETDLLDALERVGLPAPVRQHRLRLLSGEGIHIDIAYPDVALGVEPGASWWHGGNVRMRNDYRRDIGCTAIGWQIIRFDEEQLKNPMGCAVQVREAYRGRAAHYIPPAP